MCDAFGFLCFIFLFHTAFLQKEWHMSRVLVAEPICTGPYKCKSYFGFLCALCIAPFRVKLFCLSLSQKQLESPRLTLCVGFSGFVRMGKPPEYPGPCFDLILTDLTGSCSRPKTRAPQRSVSFSKLQFRILLLSLSRKLQRLKSCCWSGVAAQEKREIVIILLELRIQKKEGGAGSKIGPEFGPVFGAS